jgi:hypothetical protein
MSNTCVEKDIGRAIKIQIAIAIPTKNKNEPTPTKIQPRNSGGNSSS